MRKNLLKLGAVASALVLGGYSIANAVPTLTIADGTPADTITILDGGGGDLAGAIAGMVIWHGTIGGWTLNADTGDTKPWLGTAAIPSMSLAFQATSPTAGGTLTITWSDTGFGPSTGDFSASFGGTTDPSGTSVGFTTYYNTTLLTTRTLTGSSFSGLNFADVGPLSAYYSLTEVVTITSAAAVTGVQTTGSAYLVSVPDAGSTLILLGTAMSMLGVYSRSRSKRQKA